MDVTQNLVVERARSRNVAGKAKAPRTKGPALLLTNYRELDIIPAERTMAFRSLRRTGVVAATATAVALVGIGALLTQTVIAGAVVSHGVMVVDSGPKMVQHQEGGIVAKLLVKEDDVVHAGQPLVVLDQTVSAAKLAAVSTQLAQQQARLARLLAERDSAETPTFAPYDPTMVIPEANYAAIVASETTQFNLRRDDRESQRSQLRERINQTNEQAKADQAQLDATLQQADIAGKELADVTDLYSKKLVPQQRVTDLQKALAQLQGSEGQLRSNIAADKGKVAEIELQILQVDQSLRSDLTDQIATAQSQVGTLAEQAVIAKDELSRSVVTAPQDGVVHELAIHTIGGVVQPAETLMQIVPENDSLVGEVKINPADIDQLYPGQPVTINFSAFDRGTTPAIAGNLASISPDLVQDQRTGAGYYTARIKAAPDQLDKLGPDLKLVPGMPLEAYIQTDKRTILSYLIKPLMDQVNRAFR